MSIATEIERINNAKNAIKLAIENKGLEVGNGTIDTYAEKINQISTGGGSGDFSINGDLVTKMIVSGNVAKGDFVCSTENQVQTHLSSKTEISPLQSQSTVVNDIANIYDGDLDTYGEFTTSSPSSAAAPAIYLKMPSHNAFGLSQEDIVTGIGVTYKYRTNQETFKTFTNTFYRFKSFSTSSITSNHTLGSATTLVPSLETPIEQFNGVEVMLKAKDLEQYGTYFRFQGVTAQPIVYMYNILWTITYLDKNKIKKVTETSDIVVGVANSDGGEGQTIEVYIPKI